MVRIRLRRVGRKKQPSFRLVAADKESPRDGRFIEVLGFYNPRTEPATIRLKEDRIFDWMSKGAQPSDSAERVLRAAGAMERYERFKAGEKIEKLMEEAAAAEAARNISEKTRHEKPAGKKKKKAKAEAEPQAEAKEEKAAEAQAEEPKAEAKEEKEEAKAEAQEQAPEAEAKAETEEAEAEEAEAEKKEEEQESAEEEADETEAEEEK